MTEYRNRLALRTNTKTFFSGWEYRYLNVTDIKGDFNNDIKIFSPMMVKGLSSVLDIAGVTQEQHLDGTVWPSLLIDFGQWKDTIDITCYMEGPSGSATDIGGTSSRIYDTYKQFSTFLRWVKRGQADFDNQVFLQLYVKDINQGHNPRCGFDPIDTPYFAKEGFGFPGLVGSINLTKHPAGDGSLEFNIKFLVGRVVPI